MAYYCIDYNNGSDTTGDGSASSPWQTIAHAETQINGGTGYITTDEIRIASSTKSTKIGEGSTASYSSFTGLTINTTTDLTTQLSVGDVVTLGIDGGGTATQGSGEGHVYQVKSITASQLVVYLQINYENSLLRSTSNTYDIFKITDFVEVEVNGFSGYQLDNINSQGNATTAGTFSNDVVISGGWDSTNFTSKATWPFTAFVRTGTYQSTNVNAYGTVFRWQNSSWGFQLKDFCATRLYFTDYQTSSVESWGHNLENIRSNGSRSIGNAASNDTFSGTITGTRKLTNVFFNAQDIKSYTGSAPVVFDSCLVFGTNNSSYPAIGGSLTTDLASVTQFEQDWTTQGGHKVWTSVNTSVELLDAHNYSSGTDANNLKNLPVTRDLSAFTFYDVNNQNNSIVVNGERATSRPEVIVPNSVLAISNPIMRSIDSIDNATLVLDTSQVDEFTSNQFVGSYPALIKDSITSEIWNVLGRKGLMKLNTVDNATGSNCIQIKPNSQGIIESAIGPIAFKKGDTVDLSITAKSTGGNIYPAMRLAGANAFGPYQRYNAFQGLENFGIISGGDFTSAGYTTNTYRITSAFSFELYGLYVGQIAMYVDNIGTSNLLIDEITYTVS